MTLEVMDDDIGSDDKVGETTVKLSAYCIPNGIDTWIDIKWRDKTVGWQGKVVGQVHLKSVWHPRSVLEISKQKGDGPEEQHSDFVKSDVKEGKVKSKSEVEK